MYHLVYLTTNLINNKIYVGVHSTIKLSDGYLGSGKALIQAIKKYGKDSFKRYTLHLCLTQSDAYEWEGLIVDKTFISRKDSYNQKLGGKGGMRGYVTSEATKEKLRKKRTLHDSIAKSIRQLGTKRTKETKEKQRISALQSGHSAKPFKAITPNGVEIIGKNFTSFCKEYNFPRGSCLKNIGIGKIPLATVKGNVRNIQPTYVGWEFIWL
jgi:hypothetical protein